MTRRVAFIFVLLMSALVVACGRQVTPNPPGLGPGGAPPGYLAVYFTTASPFNFGNYQYLIVLNTSGDGHTPSTDTIQTNWDGYSYAMVTRGNAITSFAQAIQFRRSTTNPHIPPAWLPLHTTPQNFSFNLNANGANDEFSILSQKRVFSSPMPSPSPTSNVWTFNAFVTQANGSGTWQFYDSMGPGGPVDPQFVSPQLNMLTCFDNTYYARGYVPPDPAAQIETIEVANNPGPPASPCPPS